MVVTDVSGQSISPIFRGRRSRPLQTGPIGCPETPIRNYRYTPRKIAKERGSYLHRGGSLKSRNSGDIGNLTQMVDIDLNILKSQRTRKTANFTL